MYEYIPRSDAYDAVEVWIWRLRPVDTKMLFTALEEAGYRGTIHVSNRLLHTLIRFEV